jgi:pSer/pThr/pTyr-binding forkhead associated (FHA) protein
MDVPLEAPRPRVVIEWPWGARTELGDQLNIGRDYGFCSLAKELTPYTHVSRKHAELKVCGDGLWVRDLGSRNGTYVNDEEVPKGQAFLVDADALLRFGPSLSVSLKIYG